MSNPLRGIALKILSVVIFTVMATLLKAASATVPAGQQVFFRSFFAIPVILGWLAVQGNLRSGLRVASVLGHAMRGIAGTVAMGTMFWGLALLPLPESTALGYTSALITVVFAAMFLDEKVGIYRMSMVVIGFVGVLVVLYPRLEAVRHGMSVTETLGAVVTLCGAVFTALAMVFIRKLVATEQVSAIVFWFSVTSTILSLVTIPFGWVVPSATTTLMLIGAGTIGGFAQIALTSSYYHADASLIAPFDYSSMLLALLLGWTVFGDVPTAPMLIGAAIIIAAGSAIILRERVLGLERTRARKAQSPPR